MRLLFDCALPCPCVCVLALPAVAADVATVEEMLELADKVTGCWEADSRACPALLTTVAFAGSPSIQHFHPCILLATMHRIWAAPRCVIDSKVNHLSELTSSAFGPLC